MPVPDLRRRILRNRLCFAVFSLGGGDTYVVGGYLRDLVLRGVHSRDIDFVSGGDFRALAERVSDALGGKVVELKRERMARVVLEGGETLDFSPMDGYILDDLRGRDFTINALGWSPGSGLLDPCGGLGHIQKGIVSAISKDNLRKDPVRLLRAYRFQAELGMRLEPQTRRMIRLLAPRIRQSATERITLDFFKLLNSESPSRALMDALSDGLLAEIIPLSISKLRSNIKSLSNLERNIKRLHDIFNVKQFSQGLTVRGLLRLERLMLGADIDSALLSLSSDIRKRLEITGRLYPRFINIDKSSGSDMYELFYEAGDAGADMLVLTGHLKLLEEFERFRHIERRGLIDTEEVISLTGVERGPLLGRILRELRRLRFTGEIKGKRDARRWLSGLRKLPTYGS